MLKKGLNIFLAKQEVGNVNQVFIKKLKKDKVNLNKNFYVFTGSTVGVVPIGKGLYKGKIDKLGSVKTIIR